MGITDINYIDYNSIANLGDITTPLNGAVGIASLYGIFQGSVKIATKDKLGSQIDGGLLLTESIGGVATSAVSVGDSLEKAAFITKNSLEAISVLSIIGTVLSVASIIFSTRKYFQASQFSDNFENLKSSSSYTGALLSFTQMEHINKILKINKYDLFSRMNTLLAKATTPEEKEEISKKIYEGIQGRVQTKIRSEALSILIGIISLIGSSILLVVPAAPVGFALMGVATVISIGQFIYNWQVNRRFNALLEPINLDLQLANPSH